MEPAQNSGGSLVNTRPVLIIGHTMLERPKEAADLERIRIRKRVSGVWSSGSMLGRTTKAADLEKRKIAKKPLACASLSPVPLQRIPQVGVPQDETVGGVHL